MNSRSDEVDCLPSQTDFIKGVFFGRIHNSNCSTVEPNVTIHKSASSDSLYSEWGNVQLNRCSCQRKEPHLNVVILVCS